VDDRSIHHPHVTRPTHLTDPTHHHHHHHQVREFVEKAFAHVGIEVDWQGERGSVDEVCAQGGGTGTDRGGAVLAWIASTGHPVTDPLSFSFLGVIFTPSR
jgi:hypothetical protein